MRRLAQTLMAVLFLTVGVLALAGPAAAAPVRIFSQPEQCAPLDGGEFCFSSRSVLVSQEQGSGDLLNSVHNTFETTFTLNGEVQANTFRLNGVLIVTPDFENRVLHTTIRETFSAGGQTCWVTFNTTFTNGVLHHYVNDSGCHPSGG